MSNNIFGKVFKPKSERTQKKADKAAKKVMENAREDIINSEASRKLNAANDALKAQKELKDMKTVRNVKAKLIAQQRSAGTHLLRAKTEYDLAVNKEYKNKNDIKKAKAHLKNYFYMYVTIRRELITVKDLEKNNEINKLLNEMSNTFKMMNKINEGSPLIKRLLFMHRYNKTKGIEDQSYDKIKKYFGEDANEIIKDDTLKKFESEELIDLLVSDKLFEKFHDINDLEKCAEDDEIVKEQPDDLKDQTVKLNKSCENSGGAEIIEGINEKEEENLTEDEMMNSANFF